MRGGCKIKFGGYSEGGNCCRKGGKDRGEAEELHSCAVGKDGDWSERETF